MDITEKLLRQKQDFDDVYKAGKKAEYDAFWDEFQGYGQRSDYQYGFYCWYNMKEIKAKYPIKANMLYATFTNCYALETLPTITPNKTTGFDTIFNAFANCYKLKSIDIDLVNASTVDSAWDSTFNRCRELTTIKKMVVLDSQIFKQSTFRECNALENITLDGVIGQNGFDIHWSTKLSADSLASIINALSTTKTGLTVTLPSTAQNNYESKYGSGSWATLTATKSNWTIAYA